jgi:hypothetical protein
MVFDPQHKGLTEIKNTRQTLAFLVAAYRTSCFVVTTGAGTRSHRRSCLSLVSLMARYAAMLQWRLLPATAMLLLAAGAITFFANAQAKKKQSRKHPKNNV